MTAHHFTIGPKSLRIVAPGAVHPVDLAAALGDALHKHIIPGSHGRQAKRRAAYTIAQMAHESAGFVTTREFASGAEYEGRRDLGNTHSGDGPRYKGRGFIQITGRANYHQVSKALGHDFVAHPERLESLYWAAEASAWWLHAHGCLELMDRRDFVGLTRRINGGTNGLTSRRLYLARAIPVSRFLVPREVHR